MVISIILIGSLLIIGILAIVYRIHGLVDVARNTHQKRVTSSNRINAVLLFIFLIAGVAATIWMSFSWFDLYHLPVASEHGKSTDSIFWITMAVTLVVFFITQILLFFFSFRYRYKEKRDAFYYPENNRLEIVWTIVPAIVLSLLIFGGLKAWNNLMDDPPEQSEVVEILGYQFAWRTRYPGNDNQLGAYDYRMIDAENVFGMDFRDRASFDDFSPREVHLPKGKPVLFKIRARDVLHSVFAPHFRLKMDAVPGMPTSFWFIPNKTTEEMRVETGNPDFNYEIACAELCGRGHFSMRLLVVVEEPEDYEKWKSEQKSWLSNNPDYLSKVPEDLKELALLKTGLDKQ
ncbi:MAG: cytochrome c oxidase subunit II [Cyclobacteriaceae bacterium]|nr:cytochrome c oxidase subunit II [Cyclobacteriaceae bacterium]